MSNSLLDNKRLFQNKFRINLQTAEENKNKILTTKDKSNIILQYNSNSRQLFHRHSQI